jgi:hypothetical protein
MIKDRPTHLLNQPEYKKLPSTPFHVDFDALPELVRKSFAIRDGPGIDSRRAASFPTVELDIVGPGGTFAGFEHRL